MPGNPQNQVVVIGAGMGGLAAAIRLAHAGFKVTLLERHAHAGGKMRTVPSAAGPVDAGPTVLTMRPVFDTLFADVGAKLDDHVTLHREEILARHFWPDGSSLDLHADPEASAAAIRDFAGPGAEADFRAFSAKARRLFEAFEAPMMYAARPHLAKLVAHVLARPGLIPVLAPHRTLAKSLARQFGDTRLAQLFGRYATYVGGSPYRAPSVLALIWHSEAQGVWRVEGGMHRLAAALTSLAENLGVDIRLGTGVRCIEAPDGQVRSVITDDGAHLHADHVVFNGDPRALTTGLLGEGVRQAARLRQTMPRSHSAYVYSFAAKPSGPDLAHHNVFFSADPQGEFEALSAGRAPNTPTLYLCAEDRGGSGAPEGPERFEIIMNGPPTSAGPSEEDATCRQRIFPQLARFGLTFSPEPAAEALTTPAGFARLFPGSDGSLYGPSPHGMMAAFNRPTARTQVKGLYLAGGGAHPGAGIPMATLSGRHAAEAIMTDHASTSPSRRMATPGGMSTVSRTTARARSQSSAS